MLYAAMESQKRGKRMDRREFLALGASAMLGGNGTLDAELSSVSGARPAAASGRPNILMIMADQLRMDCVGA